MHFGHQQRNPTEQKANKSPDLQSTESLYLISICTDFKFKLLQKSTQGT